MSDVELTEDGLKEIKKRLLNSLNDYRNTLTYMYGDAPIGILCLPKTLETILINQGILRVYDLFNRDLTEIKGVGKSRIRDITSCLDQFLSMCG